MGARRYKRVGEPRCTLLEESYQRYLIEQSVAEDPVPSRVMVDEKCEVRF